jgi:AhpD family alkylhydroperoxidase
MGVLRYRCPKSSEEVTTAIQVGASDLARMRAMGLSIWARCPHCISGHQIKAADAILEEQTVTEAAEAE